MGHQSVLFGSERVQNSLIWSKIVSGLEAALRRMWINTMFQNAEILYIDNVWQAFELGIFFPLIIEF